jgi:hypothetical protein
MRQRRIHVLNVKAHLFKLIVLGKLAFCVADDGTQAGNKYALLAESILRVVMVLLVFIYECCKAVCSMFNLDWYEALAPQHQALLDVLLLMVASYAAIKWNTRERTLAPFIEKKKGDRFLGQIMGKQGIEYVCIVNGVEHKLKTDPVDVTHKDEMAMPDSEYFPCKLQNIGAILVATEGSDLRLFATYWRLEDVFMTARHCSNTLYQSTAKVYLAKIRMTKKGNYEVDRSKVVSIPNEFFAPEENLILSHNVDAFAKELEPNMWSKLGIATVSTKVRSAYGLSVHSVGFTPDGLLVSASGRTLPNSGFEHLHHTASTQQGFSGSILICGNSVVGMHICAADGHNVALRVEYLEYLIAAASKEESASKNRKKYTYADAAYKNHYREHKYRGGVADIMQMRDGHYSIILQNGESTYGWNMNDLVECFGRTGNARKDADMFEDLLIDQGGLAAIGRRALRSDRAAGDQHLQDVQFQDDRYHDRNFIGGSKTYNDFQDNTAWENAPIEPKGKGKRKVKVGKGRAATPSTPPGPNDGYDWLYTEFSGGKPIHGPSPPKVQPEFTQVFEEYKDKIVRLGYNEGSMRYPTMTPAEEVISLRKHLQLFGDRVKSVKRAPTAKESKRIVAIVTQMMEPATFMPDEDYDQVSGALNVINSTIVGCKKSSGYPYVTQGMPTNGQVLEKFGVKGFAQHCVNEWLTPIVVKLFGKGEPTKNSKLDEGMARCITGLPLHALVNHACIFKNFFSNLIYKWKEIPVKYAFNPASTGHLEHLKEVLPGKVWESDKSKWDFNYHLWVADLTCKVTQNLAVRHPSWDEAKLAKYRDDIKKAFDQVFLDSEYRTSDGTTFKLKVGGAMKSGWFGTIAFNSIAQVVVDVAVKVRLGMDDDSILSLAIVAGGDDVNQDLTGVDMKKYLSISKELGIEMEIHERESLEHSEYFSNDIRRDNIGRLVYFPKRFTKHIEHMKTVKLEDLANALCSHMENYRHDSEKFALFENIYHRLRLTHPGHFPIAMLKSRDQLVAKQYGYEHMW